MRAISNENASSIDSWISQARQLHADIEASKGQADEILKLDAEEQVSASSLSHPPHSNPGARADGGREALVEALRDAETKRQFLASEIRFTETLAGMLGKLQLIGATLTQVDVATNQRRDFDQAVPILQGAEAALEKLHGFDEIIVVGLLKEKATILRNELLRSLEEAWGGLVTVDRDKGSITVRRSVQGMALCFTMHLGAVGCRLLTWGAW